MNTLDNDIMYRLLNGTGFIPRNAMMKLLSTRLAWLNEAIILCDDQIGHSDTDADERCWTSLESSFLREQEQVLHYMRLLYPPEDTLDSGDFN